MWLLAPPQAKMSCFVWVWDDVCLFNAEIIAWRCRAVHGNPQFATTDMQTREHRGNIKFAPQFQFTVLMDVRLGFIS